MAPRLARLSKRRVRLHGRRVHSYAAHARSAAPSPHPAVALGRAPDAFAQTRTPLARRGKSSRLCEAWLSRVGEAPSRARTRASQSGEAAPHDCDVLAPGHGALARFEDG